jgi:hypothetical protein
MPMTEQPPVATARAQQTMQTSDYHREPPVQTMLRLIVGCLVLACGVLLAQRLPNPDLFGDYVAVCRWWQRFPTQSWVAAISGCDPLVDYRAFAPPPYPTKTPYPLVLFFISTTFSLVFSLPSSYAVNSRRSVPRHRRARRGA